MTRPLSKRERSQFLKAWDQGVEAFRGYLRACSLSPSPISTLGKKIFSEDYERAADDLRKITGLPSCIRLPHCEAK